jgi:hypothetical protein
MNTEHLTNDELLAHRANAYTTGCRAAGHHKAERNRQLLAQYDEEIARRGLTVDPSQKGTFNGPGAY